MSPYPDIRRSDDLDGGHTMDTDLRIERVPITHPDAMLLVEAVQEEYVVRYGGRDESPIDPADYYLSEHAYHAFHTRLVAL